MGDPYVVLVTEKLLQRTTARQVAGLFHRFFSEYPTVQSLASADLRGLGPLLRPLGLWRVRARQLRRMARQVVGLHGGRVPGDLRSLLALHGVGDYVARATLCFAFGGREVIEDTNIRRLSSRLERGTVKQLVRNSRDPKAVNWALLDLAALACRPGKPLCGSCPLASSCKMGKSQDISHRTSI